MTSVERVSIRKAFLFSFPFMIFSIIREICVFYLLPDTSPRGVSFPASLVVFPQDISISKFLFAIIYVLIVTVLVAIMIAWPMRKIRPHVHLSPQADIRWMILGGILGLAQFSELGGIFTLIPGIGLIFGYWLAFVKFPPPAKI